MRANFPLDCFTFHNDTFAHVVENKGLVFIKLEKRIVCNLITAHGSSCFLPTSTHIHMQSKRIHQSDTNSITKAVYKVLHQLVLLHVLD